MSRAVAQLATLPVFIALGMLVHMLGAVVLRDLWRWFAVPLGVRPLMFWQAMGLITLAGFLQAGRATVKPDGETKDEWWAHSVHSLCAYLFSYLFAWGFGALWAHIGGLA